MAGVRQALFDVYDTLRRRMRIGWSIYPALRSPRGFEMTVDIFGVQSVQALAAVLTAALVLLGAVLVVAGVIAAGSGWPIPASRLLPVMMPLPVARSSVSAAQQLLASLPSRAPPRVFHRPDRDPPGARTHASG